jgi:hypothetical protein
MEISAIADVEETRKLSPRQQVLKIYPEAKLLTLGNMHEIWVIENEYLTQKFGFSYTYQGAWRKAWDRIQKRMLRKLEE